jgi:hypothetical protein
MTKSSYLSDSDHDLKKYTENAEVHIFMTAVKKKLTVHERYNSL